MGDDDAMNRAEKGVQSESTEVPDSSLTLTPPHHHGAHHSGGFMLHAGHKIKHFLHPDGRKIHICQHPEQEQSLRRHLSVINPETTFDVVIHGSPDHVRSVDYISQLTTNDV
jgi:hypothetical protein